MGLLPIPSPRFTQGASRAGIRRAAALYDKRLLPDKGPCKPPLTPSDSSRWRSLSPPPPMRRPSICRGWAADHGGVFGRARTARYVCSEYPPPPCISYANVPN